MCLAIGFSLFLYIGHLFFSIKLDQIPDLFDIKFSCNHLSDLMGNIFTFVYWIHLVQNVACLGIEDEGISISFGNDLYARI